MTKTELVDRVADRSDLTKRAAGAAVDAVLQEIEAELQRGGEISLSGFGKFHVSQRSARKGRNPRTGEPLKIKASKAPRFTAGVGLKKSVNSARRRARAA